MSRLHSLSAAQLASWNNSVLDMKASTLDGCVAGSTLLTQGMLAQCLS
ncbi:MAG: hypothetical protein HKN42_20130 [Granulosicoccus sp.]|nr:hypothetical protein [Granulosicoccus sp.]